MGLKMTKKKITKDDGRTLIFYEFGDDKTKGQKKPAKKTATKKGKKSK